MANEKKVGEIKIEKKIEIEMIDGSKKFLADLTDSDLGNVTLKKMLIKDDKGNVIRTDTSLTMKSEYVRQDAEYLYEVRLYKWTTMPKLVKYELKVPKTLKTFVRDVTEKQVLDYALGNYAIDQDKVHNGITSNGMTPMEKTLSDMRKKGVPEAAVLETEKILKSCGFGK